MNEYIELTKSVFFYCAVQIFHLEPGAPDRVRKASTVQDRMPSVAPVYPFQLSPLHDGAYSRYG